MEIPLKQVNLLMEEHPKNDKYWKNKTRSMKVGSMWERATCNDLNSMYREFLELAILIVKDKYKPEKILGNIILEECLEAL